MAKIRITGDTFPISPNPSSGTFYAGVESGTGVLKTQNSSGTVTTYSSSTGDVVGPASSTDNAIARFDSTTGKLLQNSVVTVGDTGVMAGASIDADTNTLTNIENADIKAAAAIAVNKLAALTASRAVVSDGSGFVSAATTTSTEIGFVNGVTSAIQTQLDAAKISAFGITIDGNAATISTGVKGFVSIPFACTINSWDIFADQSGSIVIDVWKDTFANFPPTVADTIAGTEKPTLSSVQKNQDLTLSTWTTAVTAGDVIGFNVDSATTVTRVTLIVKVTKT